MGLLEGTRLARSRKHPEASAHAVTARFRRWGSTLIALALLATAFGLEPPLVRRAHGAVLQDRAKSFFHATSLEIDTPAERAAVAANYDLVIVRGAAQKTDLAALRAANPAIRLYAYEQSAALNDGEVAEIRRLGHDEWLAHTCSGALIRPTDIPAMTLGDMTNPAFRAWRAAKAAAEVAAGGYDGSYLDTVGATFPDAQYTGRPCNVTDQQWRDGSAAMITAVKAAIAKPVIANGAGLGSGAQYYSDQADADVLIAAADGVQIEHFTRQAGTGTNEFYPEDKWAQDVSYLQSLGARGKLALAKTSVDVPASTATQTALRDYALATFLLGFTPDISYFGFKTAAPVTQEIPSDPGVGARLGLPLGAFTGGPGEVRSRQFQGGLVEVNPTTASLGTIPAHGAQISYGAGAVTPAPSASPCPSPTVSPSPSITPSATPSVSPAITPATPTVSPAATPTVSPTATPTVSPTATPCPSPTVSPSITPSATPAVTPTVSTPPVTKGPPATTSRSRPTATVSTVRVTRPVAPPSRAARATPR